MLRLSAKEKAIAGQTDLSEDSLRGTGNEGALNRILGNLLENAIKFTPEAGTVEVRPLHEGRRSGAGVEYTRVGIADEALPHVFTAFKQESEGLDREYERIGLGL